MLDSKAATVLVFIALILFSLKLTLQLGNLEKRVETIEAALQRTQQSTVEIQVERTYDKDMAQWGYRMIALEKKEER